MQNNQTGMKTYSTRHGITTRNPIGDLIDALAKCRTAVVSEARAQGLPRERVIRAELAAELFTGAAFRFVSHPSH